MTRFRARPYLLFTVFLGFTKDPYPYVREAALDGLAGLSESAVFEDLVMIESCYCHAVELLRRGGGFFLSRPGMGVPGSGPMIPVLVPRIKPLFPFYFRYPGTGLGPEFRVNAWDAMLVAASYPEEKHLICSGEVFITKQVLEGEELFVNKTNRTVQRVLLICGNI